MRSDITEARAALLIRCTAEEAKAIREAAKLGRRTVSAFVVHAVMNRISVQQRLRTVAQQAQIDGTDPSSSE